ncbi:MAG: Ig-like domain-containing protein, partial [Planctomycetota bacterium]|nr:Ig-like domain-containing protein [Planctomycetota bacterium]
PTPASAPVITGSSSSEIPVDGAAPLRLLLRATDPEASSIALVAANVPAKGTVSTGSRTTDDSGTATIPFTYTPLAGQSGTDTVTIRFDDGSSTPTDVDLMLSITPADDLARAHLTSDPSYAHTAASDTHTLWLTFDALPGATTFRWLPTGPSFPSDLVVKRDPESTGEPVLRLTWAAKAAGSADELYPFGITVYTSGGTATTVPVTVLGRSPLNN